MRKVFVPWRRRKPSRIRRVGAVVTLLSLLLSCGSRGGELRDGYYSAEAASYNEAGWKDYLTIYVFDHSISTVEFDARNSTGFLRSWDLAYLRRLSSLTDKHPGESKRVYINELRNMQDPARITPVPGAEEEHRIFLALARAAIEHARRGDPSIAVVDL